MVNYRRVRVRGGSYFFTANLHDRSKSLLIDHVDLLRTAFATVRKAAPFSIDAIVILPDHLHAIWTLPDGDADYPGRWKAIKSAFVRSLKTAGVNLPENAKGEHFVWQRRYWEHMIRDERDFQAHAEYIHFNPVKHGHALNPADWPYSSIHRFIRSGLLAPDWGSGNVSTAAGRYGE